jgi:hypothetical protein
MNISYLYIYKYIEKGFFESLLVIYVYMVFFHLYKFVKILNSGLVYNYFFLIIFSFIVLSFLMEMFYIGFIYMLFIIFLGFFILKFMLRYKRYLLLKI